MGRICRIKVTKNGPYLVSGNVPLVKQIIVTDKQGFSLKWKEGQEYPAKESYSLCRCGHSKNMPYCDGSHAKVGFDGTETASCEPYIEQAEEFEGPEITLTDAKSLCVHARFCDRAGGTWKLVQESSDPHSKQIAIQECCDCPSGRLVVWDKKTGKAIEPEFEQSIGLVEDPIKGVSGPIWVKGGIPVESSDGKRYEIRNRITLCRCGHSKNMPYCDGSHIPVGFTDDDKSLEN